MLFKQGKMTGLPLSGFNHDKFLNDKTSIMKRILFAAAFALGLSAFTAAQAQDTTGRKRPQKEAMKKSGAKRMKKTSRRPAADSTGMYGAMNDRRRDSM